jgi:hypothetical protein
LANNKTVGADSSKLAKQTNTARVVTAAKYAVRNDETFNQFLARAAIPEFDAKKAYDNLPTSERNRIAMLMRSDTRPTNRLSAEVYKLIQDNTAEYQQRKLIVRIYDVCFAQIVGSALYFQIFAVYCVQEIFVYVRNIVHTLFIVRQFKKEYIKRI